MLMPRQGPDAQYKTDSIADERLRQKAMYIPLSNRLFPQPPYLSILLRNQTFKKNPFIYFR